MADSEIERSVIVPPPVLLPPPLHPDGVPSPLRTAGTQFITLPPGIIPSVTVPIAAEKRRTSEIRFFPTGAGAAAAHPVEIEPAWHITLPGGQRVEVTGAVVLGRDPSRSERWPDATLLPVTDPVKSLSKTHAALEIDEGNLWVHDLDSTNGVFVFSPAIGAVQVDPGTRVIVPDGARIEFGDFSVLVARL